MYYQWYVFAWNVFHGMFFKTGKIQCKQHPLTSKLEAVIGANDYSAWYVQQHNKHITTSFNMLFFIWLIKFRIALYVILPKCDLYIFILVVVLPDFSYRLTLVILPVFKPDHERATQMIPENMNVERVTKIIWKSK